MSRERVLRLSSVIAISLFLIPPAVAQNLSIADLLIKDEIQQAEKMLEQQPKNAQTTAFRGEIEFRKGHFEQAEALYRESIKLDSQNARAHFGLGKLAMGRVKSKVALDE